jgi:predicted TIM-barrel fold metal-dependent hydrolase
MAIAHHAGATTPLDRASTLRAIDTDIHNELPAFAELRPFLARAWHPWLADGRPGFARRFWTNTGSGMMDDAVREQDGLCAGDPDWVVQQIMRKYQIDVGVLTGQNLIGLSVQHDPRFCAALASAYNDWVLEKWVRPHSCFKGSILVGAQDPEAAAREVDRLGDDPGMVQVLMSSAARIPYGQKTYWPIYAAAVEHGLPVALHVGAEGTGIASPPTGVGYPAYFLEYHTAISLTMMAHCVSLLSEGTFEQFPGLKFVFIEGGICWAPHVMWRLDRQYGALKTEVPHLKRLPSEYLLANCYFSTQPIEESPNPRHLLDLLAMLRAERTVLFASDYPHWDFDNPLTAFSSFPAALKRRVFVGNALDLYGRRLLEPSV